MNRLHSRWQRYILPTVEQMLRSEAWADREQIMKTLDQLLINPWDPALGVRPNHEGGYRLYVHGRRTWKITLDLDEKHLYVISLRPRRTFNPFDPRLS